MVAHQVPELVADDGAARPPEYIADEKNTHANSMVSPDSAEIGLRHVGVLMTIDSELSDERWICRICANICTQKL